MTFKELEGKLPLTVKLTQSLIDKGNKNICNDENCIGALALKKGLTARKIKVGAVSWMWNDGYVELNEDTLYLLSIGDNDERLDVMSRSLKPCNITFILDTEENRKKYPA